MYSTLSDSGSPSTFPCNVGTRQGDISSPLMFALFINDLCTLLREQCGDGVFITPMFRTFSVSCMLMLLQTVLKREYGCRDK